MEYYVYMTNDCNLNCAYCSVLFDCKKNNVPLKPIYKIEDLINFIKQTQSKRNDDEIRVLFFGGEPSLEYDAIRKYIHALKQHFSGNLKLVLHTNGLLLNKLPDDILSDLDLILLSLNYEKITVAPSSNDYYKIITSNVAGIRSKSNVSVTGRLTVTEKTRLYAAKKLIEDFCDQVYFQIENCLQFNDYKSFAEAYKSDILLLYNTWIKNLSEGKMDHIIPFMAVLKEIFFPDNDLSHFACGFERDIVYIQTDGRLYSCCESVPEGIHYLGYMNNGLTFKGNGTIPQKCTSCDYCYLCRGRCGRMHLAYSSNHIEEYCQLNKFMYALFLNDKASLAQIVNKYPQFKQELSGWIIELMEQTP